MFSPEEERPVSLTAFDLSALICVHLRPTPVPLYVYPSLA
jgi:hypothetical protein